MVYLGIMFGGALGALLRYLLNSAIQSQPWVGGTFPLGILVINVLGSFLLAVVTTLSLQGLVSDTVRQAIGTGFVGAFTTFSTFEWDTDQLIRSGRLLPAALYVLGNLVLGFLAVQLGRMLAGRLAGT
ncbi:fluoride efflux transporter CrcB [Deinococcus cellulosilyticus]|uniref:Fluoride-specific ion channel FluC n=1 Tax=Deinococcus cellulosilyticus (strain DSM 18568 / NBRC 106333 / KACC 11606 / 5516J-15) TaxID=1223518 RepID=A0A511N1A4_DEIC1|nr:fluoride efflux transporter CrcB [Deinococcus cellulosilyticus]GEM46126.1 putative fluoride ion transporter CrcB 2 [Deinococcus cellulosilyticus NBRC 106333 = KACC 11606]